MIWIAPTEKDTDNAALEKRLWDAADQFRANSGLKSQEYSAPVLGLIFLRFAEVRFAAQRAKLEKASASTRRGSRVGEPAAYHAEGILYLPAEARFDYLLNRPEAENIGAKVNAAMRVFSLSASTGERAGVRCRSPKLAGVLPKTYNLFTSTLLKELLKKVSEIPASLDYDAFGRIYEYFLAPWERVAASAFSGPVQGSPTGRGEFAMSEGQGGRVKAELRIAKSEFRMSGPFDTRHSSFDISQRLCRLNLAVHGLEGEIKHGGAGNCELRSANDEWSLHE